MSPAQFKLARLRNLRTISTVAFVLSFALSWITLWFAQNTTKTLEANPGLTNAEILGETRTLVTILVTLGTIVFISGATTLITIILVVLKSKKEK